MQGHGWHLSTWKAVVDVHTDRKRIADLALVNGAFASVARSGPRSRYRQKPDVRGGCYVETILPIAIDTTLELKLQLDGSLLVLAKVVTCDPQVGNDRQMFCERGGVLLQRQQFTSSQASLNTFVYSFASFRG